jgi:N-6 DNA Methylase
VNETAPNDGQGQRLVGASEVAQIARVQPSAVSNWRKRYPDFPAPAGTAASGGDLFDLSAVETWLRAHGRVPQGSSAEALEQLWAVADRLRGKALAGDLLGAVSAASALLHLARQAGADITDDRGSVDIGRRAQAVAQQLAVERPELARLFAPLLALDASSLGLLIDSLAEFATDHELAAAVDFVLERAARYAEFRTAEPAAKLLVELADPQGSVFDPAMGSAELLIETARESSRQVELHGQEINESSWRVAFARLLLRNVDAQVELGDSLLSDRFPDLRADIVLCEPPAGMRTADLDQLAGDPRWQLLGTFEAPPARSSDFVWLAHIIHHLAPGGRGYVLLPTGSLFRGGTEARFRAELLRQGTIDAIIYLPRGATTTATAVSYALWIVRPPSSAPAPVLLIDSTDEKKLTRRLRAKLSETVAAWRQAPERFEPTAGYATSVPVLELLAGEAALVPSRWLYEPELIDASALIERAERARDDLEAVRARITHPVSSFALTPADEPPTSIRVRELIELGHAHLLRPLRVKTDAFGEEGLPVWLPADVNEPWKRDEQPRFIDPALVDARSITEPGDIVFTTIGGIRTRVDDEGGHVLGTSLQALRLAPNTFDPHAVAALLTSEPNRRLLTGTTIPRVNVLELEFPRLDPNQAKEMGELLQTLDAEQETANAVAARAEALRQALVDAIATGAAKIRDTSQPEDGQAPGRRSSKPRVADR